MTKKSFPVGFFKHRILHMNLGAIRKAIRTDNWPQVEDLWMAGVEDNPDPKAVGTALEAMVKADNADTAETLAGMLLEAHGSAEADAKLAWASAALLAIPESAQLRSATAELCKAVYSDAEHFGEIWSAADLEGIQSPKRALRTLDICIGLKPETYMGNKFDGRVIRIERFNALGEFEFQDDGMTETLDPKLLADEFEPLTDDDFRVIIQQDPETVSKVIAKQPGDVLVGLCRANGGSCDADTIKETLVPKYLDTAKWSGWWSRARTAGKKNPHLAFEGRSPVTVNYVAGGFTLEEELADDLAKAYEPLELLTLLRIYLREIKGRKLTMDVDFAQKIVDKLASRIADWSVKRPGEALEGALGLDAAVAANAPQPAQAPPTAADILARTRQPAAAILAITQNDLWPPALQTVREHPDTVAVLAELLVTGPSAQIQAIASHLGELDEHAAIAEAVKASMVEPAEHIDLLAWAWSREGADLADLPPRVTILSKLLDAMLIFDNDPGISRQERREARATVRAAMSAAGYKSFRACLSEINEGMAAVIKNKLERTDGLAQTVTAKLLYFIRESYWKLFVVEKPKPWLDSNIVWTSQVGLDAQQEEMRIIIEELMPANAKQIGEAAEQGDLRENADWQAAIEERDMLVSRQRAMNNDLLRARVITLSDVPKDEVSVGSKVILRRDRDGEMFTVNFLGPWDSDPDNDVYAYTTRLGEKLMGKLPGMTLSLQLGGNEEEFTVTELGAAVTE